MVSYPLDTLFASRMTGNGDASGTSMSTTTTTSSAFPFQTAPTYNFGAVSSDIRRYESLMAGLQQTPWNFNATPVSWQDVRAQQVSATGVADDVLSYNQSRLPQFTRLAADLTAADTAVKMAELDKFVPQWRTQRDKAGAINDALMRGEIPTDVANRLRKDAAFASIMGSGYGGEDNQRSLTARDLGLTSLDLQQQGMQGAQSWTTLMASLMPEQTTAAGVMGSFGLTTQMGLETSLQNAANQLQADTTNAQGRVDTSLRSQGLLLDAETARQQTNLDWAGLKATGYQTALDFSTSNQVNRYNADRDISNIDIANRFGLYNQQQTTNGLNTGLTAGASGFGIY